MVRTTIYLDDQIRERLQHLVPPRKLNRFINEAVADKVAALEQQQLEQAMREGYLAACHDREVLNCDWDAVDTLDWPG
jgi:predicted transcriptional regulator